MASSGSMPPLARQRISAPSIPATVAGSVQWIKESLIQTGC